MGRTEDIADVYRHTFPARIDAYSDWSGEHTHRSERPDGSAEEVVHAHWEARREELTVERVVAALKEKRPISGFMENADGCTHVGAIDFDREDGWLKGAKVARTLADLGAFPMLERSRRGCHLWVVMSALVPGEIMRLALRHAVFMTEEYLAHDKQVEILPKRVERREDTLGNPLRLPLMAHPKTGVRYPLCDFQGTYLGQSYGEILLNVEFTKVEIIEGLAANAKLPPADMRVPHWARQPSQEGGDCVEVLQSVGIVNAAPGRTVRCPLHDDRMASLAISRDGERVWCKSPACDAYNDGKGLGSGQLGKALGASRAVA